AGERVVAEAAGQDIVAVASADRIGRIISGEDVVARTAGQVLEAGNGIGALAAGLLRRCEREIDRDAGGVVRVGQRIVAGAAVEHVVAGAAEQAVVLAVALQQVVESGADDVLHARGAVARGIAPRGRAAAAGHGAAGRKNDGNAGRGMLVAQSAAACIEGDVIGTGAALDDVMAATAVDDVAAGAAPEIVVAAVPGDVLAELRPDNV